ncbi:MAG: response regulator, partial [Candidatus Thorarchaeota archaeon]
MEEKLINILLIEDNSADVRLVKELLKKSKDLNYKLTSNSRLSESLNSLHTNDYDIILLDLKLPDSERDYTLERILNATKNIPIVILTGL